MQNRLTVPAYCDAGVWFPRRAPIDVQASQVWSPVARTDPARAAAATPDRNLFAKYPEWVRPHFTGCEGTLLDAGCGYGRVAIPLLESNPKLRCVGVDASPVMLNTFRQLAGERGVGDRVELYCGTLRTLPFPDAHFDFGLSCAVLLHLPKREARDVIQEIGRVLVRNGKLLLTASFPNVFNPEGFTNIRHNFRGEANGPVRAYTRREVTALFGGFSEVTVEAHQMIVLPRGIASVPMPFANLSRTVNQYCSRRFMDRFKHSTWLVNHHDVVAVK